jgi:hypothetical protein
MSEKNIHNLKTSLVESFIDSFNPNSNKSTLLFVGKPDPWENEEPGSVVVPTYENSQKNENEVFSKLLACKSVNKDNVIFIVPRINWQYEKVYDIYDDSIDLFAELSPVEFYCVNSNFCVYKCLSNGGGTGSKIEPTSKGTEEEILSDGYTWKFLYIIPDDYKKFITDDYIPVIKLSDLIYTDERSLQKYVELDSVDGSIDHVELVSTGGTYPHAVTITDDSSTNQLMATTVYASDSSANIVYLDLIRGASKIHDFYNDNYMIYIPSSGGDPIQIIDYNGTTGKATLASNITSNIEAGMPYEILPYTEIVGDGVNAKAIPVIDKTSKQITEFVVVNRGENYHSATIKIYTTNDDETIAVPMISPRGGHGYSAYEELGTHTAMICVDIDQNDELFTVGTEYRQIGLIQNALLSDGSNQFAGQENPKKIRLHIENLNCKSYIYFESISSNEVTILQNSLDKTLTQGPISNKYQARGVIESYNAETKILTVKNTQGRFQDDDSSVYKFVVENYYDTGTNKNVTLDSKASTITRENQYDDDTFSIGSFVIGSSSLSTGIIEDWKSELYGTDGILDIKNVQGNFINASYDLSGNIVLGEKLLSFSSIDFSDATLIGVTVKTTGVITKIEDVLPDEPTKNYLCTTKITLVSDTDFSGTEFSRNDTVIQSNTSATGLVVSWTLDDTDNKKGTLELTNTTGYFLVGFYINLYNNDLQQTVNAYSTEVRGPDILPYSGKLIYIKNVEPVFRSNDQSEELKLVIEF